MADKIKKKPDEQADENSQPQEEAQAQAQAQAQAHRVEFEELESEEGGSKFSLDLILDISMPVTVELGRATMTVQELLQLGVGSVVQLDKMAGEPADMYVRDVCFARGEVVVVDNNFGLRITEIIDRRRRLQELGQ